MRPGTGESFLSNSCAQTTVVPFLSLSSSINSLRLGSVGSCPADFPPPRTAPNARRGRARKNGRGRGRAAGLTRRPRTVPFTISRRNPRQDSHCGRTLQRPLPRSRTNSFLLLSHTCQFESFFFVGVPRVGRCNSVPRGQNRLEISSFRRVTVPSSRPLRSSSNVPRQKSMQKNRQNQEFLGGGEPEGGWRDSCPSGRSNVKRSPSTAYEARESSLRKPHTAEANSQA